MKGKTKLVTGLLLGLGLPLAGWSMLHSGPYVGLGIGSQNFSTRITNSLSYAPPLASPVFPADPQIVFDNKIALTGVLGDVYLGWQYYCNQFWGAIEGEYQFGSNNTHLRKTYTDLFAPNGPGTAEVSFKAQQGWSASLLLGYEVLCGVAFYLRGGYQQAQFKSNSIEAAELGVTGKINHDVNGYLLGLGIQTEICQGFGMRLEYRYVGYSRNNNTRISNSGLLTVPPIAGIVPGNTAVVTTKFHNPQDNQMFLSANYVFDLCL